MTKLFIAAAIAGIIAAPAVAEQGVAPAGGMVEASDPAAAAIVADCSARKFETSVELEKDGKKRLTKMKICAAKGEDQFTWVKTLEDAKAKISAHLAISNESKTKIVAELDAEIARIRTMEAASISLPAISALPMLSPADTRKPEYSVYQPLPKLPPVAALTTSASAPVPVKPRLTIRCLPSGERGEGSPCTFLERTTQLTILADEDLTGDTRLRFLRRGDERGELALARMRQGQLLRSRLPPQLCSGVISSKVEIQVMRSNQVLHTLGPYQLRC